MQKNDYLVKLSQKFQKVTLCFQLNFFHFFFGDQKEQIVDQLRKLMSAQLDIAMSKLSADSLLKTRLEV